MTHVGSGTSVFDGSELRVLLSENQITLETLDELFGCPGVGADLLNGTRLPSLHEATLLGALLRLDPGVLTGRKAPSLGVSLRLGSAGVQHDVARPVEHATRLLAADRLAEDWGLAAPRQSLPDFPVSKTWHNKEAGRATARRLRAYLALGSGPVGDLTAFVEGLGYPVEYRPLPENVHGISVPERRKDRTAWTVLINSNDGWGRQRFTLAHELSHIVYGDSGQFIVDRAEKSDIGPERIADSFARHFLLPDEALGDILRDHGAIADRRAAWFLVADIMLTYGISRDATVIALGDTELFASDLLDACADVSVASIMEAAGRSEEWARMDQTWGQTYPSVRLTQCVLAGYGDGVLSLQTVADVIAGGDRDDAAVQLRNAGWDIPPGPGAAGA